MKKLKISILLILISLFVLGCFTEEVEESIVGKGVSVKKINEKVNVESLNEFRAAEIIINKELNIEDINVKDDFYNIIEVKNGKTIILIVSPDKNILSGEELFFIENISENIEISLGEKITYNEINISANSNDNILLGDFDNNDIVNEEDLKLFKNNYGLIKVSDIEYSDLYDIAPAKKGEGEWEEIYSISNPDNKVNIYDFLILISNLNKTKPTNEVEVPKNISPLNNSTDVKLSTKLVWTSNDPEVDKITLLLGKNENNLESKGIQLENEYYIENLEKGETYYWQVIASDGTKSEKWRFITEDKEEENVSPSKPESINPLNEEENVKLTTKLEWNSVDPDGDDLTYKLYFGESKDNLNIIINQTEKEFTVRDLKEGTTYYWQVIVNDGVTEEIESLIWEFKTEEEEKENRKPSKPEMISPANESQNLGLNVKLEWNSIDEDGDDLTYKLYFGESKENFEEEVIQTEKEYTVRDLKFETTYYWQVIVSDGESEVESDKYEFITKKEDQQKTIPSEPENIKPLNETIDTELSVELEWNSIDEDGDSLDYKLYFGETKDDLKLKIEQNEYKYTVENLVEGTIYYWQVVVSDKENQIKSKTWEFTTKARENLSPSEPERISPKNEEIDSSLGVKFEWNSTDEEDELTYELWIGKNKDSLNKEITTKETSYSIDSALSGTTYYWQIIVSDGVNEEVVSDIWEFSTKEEKQENIKIELLSKTSATVKLEWNAVAGASLYKVYRSKTENGTYEEIKASANRIEVYYENNWSNANIHYDIDKMDSWTVSPGEKMEKKDGKYYKVIEANSLEFCFNDGNTWDNNSEQNYEINESGVYTVSSNNGVKKDKDILAEIIDNNFEDINLGSDTTYFYKVAAVINGEEGELSSVIEVRTEFKPHEMLIAPFLTWNGENQADRGLVINYATHTDCISKVEYGTTEALGEEEEVKAKDKLTDFYVHHVELKNLEAGTKYYYRVFEGNKSSKVYHFSIAEVNDNEFKYIVAGDMQDPGNGEQRWADSASEIKKMLNSEEDRFDFMILVGDMPQDDKYEKDNWIYFFKAGEGIFPYVVIMPILGNHDTNGKLNGSDYWVSNPSLEGTEAFRKLFTLPIEEGVSEQMKETYFEFNYGTAKFFGLNSEVMEMGSSNGLQYFQGDNDHSEQFDWINNELSNDDFGDSTWAFAYWHIPPYAVAKSHYDEQFHARKITKNFEGKIDWVFNGHTHVYQRMKPVRYAGRTDANFVKDYGRGSNQGVGYTVCPPAGNIPRLYEFDENYVDGKNYKEHLAYPENGDTNGKMSEMGFVLVEINGKKMHIETYGIGNDSNKKPLHIIDDETIEK